MVKFLNLCFGGIMTLDVLCEYQLCSLLNVMHMNTIYLGLSSKYMN